MVDAGRDESAPRSALVTVVDPEGVATLRGGDVGAGFFAGKVPVAAIAGAELLARVVRRDVLSARRRPVGSGVACVAVEAPAANPTIDVSPADLSAERQLSTASAKHTGAIAERSERCGEGGCPMITP